MTKKRHSSKPIQHAASRQKHKTQRRQPIPWLWIGLGVAVLAIAGFLLLSAKAALPAEIAAAQAYEKYQQGAFFLDVRSQEEWAQAHVPNSVQIPLDELQGRLNDLPRDRDIVVVCLSGKRSKEGVSLLRQAGFDRVTCLSGGLQAWIAAGYPAEAGAQATSNWLAMTSTAIRMVRCFFIELFSFFAYPHANRIGVDLSARCYATVYTSTPKTRSGQSHDPLVETMHSLLFQHDRRHGSISKTMTADRGDFGGCMI